MIDITHETLVTLSQAARSLPPGRKGKPSHLATVQRWILHGVRGVRLEGVRLGGRWLTSREALARFAERLTAAATQPTVAAVSNTALANEACRRAEEELANLGI
jgi:hypothetical protein